MHEYIEWYEQYHKHDPINSYEEALQILYCYAKTLVDGDWNHLKKLGEQKFFQTMICFYRQVLGKRNIEPVWKEIEHICKKTFDSMVTQKYFAIGNKELFCRYLAEPFMPGNNADKHALDAIFIATKKMRVQYEEGQLN